MESEAAKALTHSTQQEKTALRKRIQADLKAMTPEARAAASIQACALLEQQSVWRDARAILFFAPLAGEPDLWRLVEDSVAAGKLIALPRFSREHQAYVAALIENTHAHINHGEFGIREPHADCAIIELNRLDLMLVPGVAFDLDGRRLGRGKGYYDRLLSKFDGVACGVAFDQQIVPRVPSEAHDARVNCVLTPARWHPVPVSSRF